MIGKYLSQRDYNDWIFLIMESRQGAGKVSTMMYVPGPSVGSGDADIADLIPENGWTKWGMGGGLACLVFALGLVCIIHRSVTFYYESWVPFTIDGTDAVAIGMALLGLALLLHCHFFWSQTRRLGGLAEVGKAAALLISIISAAVLIVRMGILDR